LADPVLRPQLDAESEALALGPASSAWVVAGRRTRSKAPLLVNDFSWAPQLPALFYQIAGRTPAREISGNTLPGVPFLFSGHNRHVGWGISPARSDTLDCFLLERHPRDPRLYRCDGRWLELRFGEQRIRCRGRGDITLRVAASLFGPVIEAGGELLAVRSTAQNRTLALDALFRMNLAHGLKDFAAALPRFTAPVLSVVYCDRRGNIGAARTGLEPRRGRGDGLLPLRAVTLADGWKDLQETGVSAIEDPGRGWLADFDLDERTAAARAFFTFDPVADPRRRRLGELLDAAGPLDAAAAARLQNDLRVAGAECLARLVQGAVLESSGAQRAQEALAAWDFIAGDGEGASYFYEIERRLAAAVFCPGFPASATRICAAVREPGLWGREELRTTVESVLRDADESRRVRTRRQEDAWRWEVLHTVSFRHPLGRFFFLRPLFERGPFGIHGGGSCLLDSGAAPGAGFKATRLAAYRMVLDFSDFAQSLLVYPGGQSGHPLSPSFDDQLAPYLSQKYLKMEAGNRRTYTLRLLPEAADGGR
jgi:penicillin amidase